MFPSMLRFVAVAVVLSLAGVASEETEWIVAEDNKVAADAVIAKATYCAGGLKGDFDRETGREQLLAAMGGENVLLETMQVANSSNLQTVVADKLAPKVYQTVVVNVVVPIILVILWFCCSWYSCCPCFKRCCRCCSKSRTTGRVQKVIILIAAAGIAAGMIISAGASTGGYNKAVDGFDNLACTAASLLDGMLSGQNDTYFIGMLPLLRTFEKMDKDLDYNADFMTGLRNQIESTKAIEESMSLSTAIFVLLRESISTKMPAEVVANKHKCEFCNVMTEPLDATVKVLDEGMAASLSAARTEVKTQLGPQASKDLQKTLRDAAAPIVESKTLIRNSLSFFTDTDKFMQVRGHLSGDGPNTVKHLVNSGIVWAIFLTCCVGLTLGCFCLREGPAKKPKPMVPRCAACNWCCSWCFAMWVFLIGGIMLTVAWPMSGICLIMDDLSVQMLKDISPALGMGMNTTTPQQMYDIIDQCIVPSDPSSNAQLKDIIKPNASDPNATLRTVIVDDLKDVIMAKFAALSSGDAKLADNQQMKDLMIMLSDPLDVMILFQDPSLINSDPQYKDMFTDATLTAAATGSSVRCPNGTVGPKTPAPMGNKSISGVQNFVATLAALGTRLNDRPDCADTVVCTTGSTLLACQAGNNFVQLKRNILDLANFRCDVFLDPVDMSSDCDPINLVGTLNHATSKTTWTNTCQKADGTMTVKRKDCKLPQFVTYVQGFKMRVDNSLKRVDKTVAETGTGISVGMRDLVKKHIFTPIEFIADGGTCGFMGQYYRQVVNGLCYQGVVGFVIIGKSYQACGVIALFMIVLMYGVWRRTIDNVNAAKKVQADEVFVQ
mmetsp:Transcript_177495/g.569244  ORF Transcript_177495/g.569244 Transcript_177495/m.569244 type:complete len:835 (-) Transcript_177495:375-2879(-)